jgi:hypothetical protein
MTGTHTLWKPVLPHIIAIPALAQQLDAPVALAPAQCRRLLREFAQLTDPASDAADGTHCWARSWPSRSPPCWPAPRSLTAIGPVREVWRRPAPRRVLSNLLRFAELDLDSAGLVLGCPFPTERSSTVPVELQFLFYLAAFLCFALAAVAFRAPWVGRVNLIGLGLALWVFVPLVGALRRVN